MGGRGAASSATKWGWQDSNGNGPKITWIDKDPIGPENKPMYKDTVKNITSIFPILKVKDIEPLSINGALGVASIGYEKPIIHDDGTATIQGKLKLGFNPKTFATQESLQNVMDSNFKKNWLSTNKDNHIVAHEIAHMLDNQLTIKKHYNMSLDEWTSPRRLDVKAAINEINIFKGNIDNKKFSAGFANELQKELKQSPQEILGQVSKYAQAKESEFFAEVFAKWYLSDRKGEFNKAVEKVLKRKINNL